MATGRPAAAPNAGLLTLTTGLVDAASYLGLGHVVSANMTIGLAADSPPFGGTGTGSLRRTSAVLAMLAGARCCSRKA